MAAFAGDHVVGAGLDRGIQHGVIGGGAALIFDDTGVLEHEGDRAGLAEIAAGLAEERADVGGGAIAVVGQRLDDDSDAAGAITLVTDLVIALRLAAHRLLDGALDIVLGHVLLARRNDGRLRVWVEAAADDSTAMMRIPCCHGSLNDPGQIPWASETTRMGANTMAASPGHHATNPAKNPQNGPSTLRVQT